MRHTLLSVKDVAEYCFCPAKYYMDRKTGLRVSEFAVGEAARSAVLANLLNIYDRGGLDKPNSSVLTDTLTRIYRKHNKGIRGLNNAEIVKLSKYIGRFIKEFQEDTVRKVLASCVNCSAVYGDYTVECYADFVLKNGASVELSVIRTSEVMNAWEEKILLSLCYKAVENLLGSRPDGYIMYDIPNNRTYTDHLDKSVTDTVCEHVKDVVRCISNKVTFPTAGSNCILCRHQRNCITL